MFSIIRTSKDLYFNLYLIDEETESPRTQTIYQNTEQKEGKIVQVASD